MIEYQLFCLMVSEVRSIVVWVMWLLEQFRRYQLECEVSLLTRKLI